VSAGVPEWPAEGATVEDLLRFQSAACGALGSPLYKALLSRAADDFVRGGPTRRVLEDYVDDPRDWALGLRLMGAVHRLVLEGAAPELAARYRSQDGDRERDWAVFSAFLEGRAEQIRPLVGRPVQTNEVGRCAALLPGFLSVASRTRLPLRLLEVGASGGLNLRWDAYRYEADGFSWGSPDSPLRIPFELEGGPVPETPAVEVAQRLGCDPSPVDPATEEGRLTLLSYTWPDMRERLERLRAGFELAEALPATVEQGRAAEWTEARLAEPAPGSATVVFHSVVIQYLPEDERRAFEGLVEEAGTRAGADAPLAWLRMEPAGERAEVRITTWPGGEERLLARAGYHGTPVDLSPGAG
jgi:hypothetical protein